MKWKRELAELLFIDVKEGFIHKLDLGYTLVSPIIKLRLHISLSYNSAITNQYNYNLGIQKENCYTRKTVMHRIRLL